MKFEPLYKDILSSFGQLWKYKERGKSIEIITPFATTSQKFVTVFLTEKNNEYIVSDGGWISECLYDNSYDRTINCFEKVFLYYQSSFEIKETRNLTGNDVFYKKTKNAVSIPSLIFDLSNFISTIVSVSNVEFSERENETERNFNKQAREYLADINPNYKWRFNTFFDNKKVIKVNAILQRKNSRLVLLNFITGSNYTYFSTNISKSNIIFEMADRAKGKNHIENKIVLLDNKARGYKPDKWGEWLRHLVSTTHSKVIEWSNKKELNSILN